MNEGLPEFLTAIKEGADYAAAQIRRLQDELRTHRRLLWMIARKHDFIVVSEVDVTTMPPDGECELESYYDPVLRGTVVRALHQSSEGTK